MFGWSFLQRPCFQIEVPFSCNPRETRLVTIRPQGNDLMFTAAGLPSSANGRILWPAAESWCERNLGLTSLRQGRQNFYGVDQFRAQ
jgi:hypothetical protein